MVQGQAKSEAAPAHPQTEVIELPPARKNGGMPLISAFKRATQQGNFLTNRFRSRRCPICYGPPSASIARTAIEPRRIGGMSW